jgi:hypothetical protein
VRFKEHIDEASAAQAVERATELHNLLMKTDALDNLKDAHMKIKKEAAKIFQQAINLLKGLK